MRCTHHSFVLSLQKIKRIVMDEFINKSIVKNLKLSNEVDPNQILGTFSFEEKAIEIVYTHT